MLPNANEREKIQPTFLDIDALHGVSRVVKQITARIAASGALRERDHQQDCSAGNRGGSTTPGSHFGKDSNAEEGNK